MDESTGNIQSLTINSNSNKKEIRIGVLGNVDSGKTTLISVIAHKILDNGRGLARQKVLKHNHEKESGRTSSITHTYYNSDNRIISFVDLAGHEKYYKTTIFGANCCSLDYVILLVGANMGVSLMTREHFLLTLILKLPFTFIITKVDLAPENILKQTLGDIKILLNKYKPKHKMVSIDKNNIDTLSKSMYKTSLENSVPIIQISNTTGLNIDLLTNYLKSLEVYRDWDLQKNELVSFTIEDTYQVTGVGFVVTGTLTSGVIKKGAKFMIGPINGNFVEVVVKSMHNNYQSFIDVLEAGCSGCLCVKSLEKRVVLRKDNVKRGMHILDKNNDQFTCRQFEAKIKILHHPTTIKKNYESIIHCGPIRQSARIIHIDKDLLRTGDQSRVIFRFKIRPECIKINRQIMFREGKTKGIGVVTKLLESQ